jgi:colanic acid/amylovoran biosynthesis glycosyltransferase
MRDERSASVALVVNQFPAGSEPCIVRKFLGLLERGWDVHMVCKRRDNRQWEFFPGLREDPKIRQRVHTGKDIVATLSALKPEIVNFESGGSLVDDIARIKERTAALMITGFRGSDIKVYGIDDPACYRDVWEHSTAVHVVADHLWEDARRRGCPSDLLHAVIPSAIDPAAFPLLDRSHEDIAGSTDRPLRVLSVGRLHWVKGYNYALQAIRLLRDEGVEVEYRIAGEGDHRPSILFDIYDLELDKSVNLLGACAQPRVRQLMEWADVLLHSSVSEGSPNTLLEAFATGLPVVAAETRGVLECAPPDALALVPARDAFALARTLEALGSNPEERQRISDSGVAAHGDGVHLEGQLDGFESLYRRVLHIPGGL